MYNINILIPFVHNVCYASMFNHLTRLYNYIDSKGLVSKKEMNESQNSNTAKTVLNS